MYQVDSSDSVLTELDLRSLTATQLPEGGLEMAPHGFSDQGLRIRTQDLS